MSAEAGLKWDALPGIIEINTFDAATNTIVGKNPTDLQTWTNIFIEGAQLPLKKDSYVHVATAIAAMVDVVLLAHFYPQICTLLPVPSKETQELRKAVLAEIK